MKIFSSGRKILANFDKTRQEQKMEVNNSNLLKLEGVRNWNIWKFQTKVLLRGHGWLDIVEGRTVKPESLTPQDVTAKTTWETKDAKAQTLLVTRMSDDIMLHLISCTTSAEMWKKLLSVFEHKSRKPASTLFNRNFSSINMKKELRCRCFCRKFKNFKAS